MKKIKKRPMISLFTILFLFVTSSCTQHSEETSKQETLKIGVLRVADSVPLYIGMDKGIFEKNGVKVELVEFGSASDESKAMEAGELDGMMTDLVVLNLINKGGGDLRAVAMALGATQEEGRFAIISSPESAVKQVLQLEGCKIATSQNSMMEYLIDRYCEELGVDIDKIEKINIPSLSLRLDVLMEGRDVDCAILPDPLAAFAIANQANVIIDDTKLSVNRSQTVIVLSEKIIKEKELLSAFLTGYYEAVDEINQNKENYREKVLEIANVPADIVKNYPMPSYTKNTVPDEEIVGDITKWMVEKGLLDKQPVYEEVVYVSGN